jgi:hypothetical protein
VACFQRAHMGGCLVAGSAGRWHFHGARNNAIMPVIGRVCECAIVCAAATPAAYIFVRAYIDHVCGGSARERARVALFSKAERDASPLKQQRLDRSRRFILAR